MDELKAVDMMRRIASLQLLWYIGFVRVPTTID